MKRALKDLKKNVLVVVSIPSQFPELFRIAQYLKKSDEFNPIVYFNLGVRQGSSNLNTCIEQGIDVLDYSKGFVKSKKSLEREKLTALSQHAENYSYRKMSFLQNFKTHFKRTHPAIFNSVKELFYRSTRNLNYFIFLIRIAAKLIRLYKEWRLLKLFSIELMVFAEDNEEYYTPQLIRLGHQRKIKSVVFPYTFANQFEFLEDAFLNDRRLTRGVFNFLIGKFLPKWTRQYKGKKLLRSEPSIILSSEIFKTAPPNPWIMSSGHSDVIAVESAFMKEYYAKAGIPKTQMIEVGSFSLDHLYYYFQNRADLKKSLAQKYNLDGCKPWIVCALPPYQRSAGLSFKEYQIFLEEFIYFFNHFKNVETLFKFHPRFELVEIKEMCDKLNIKYIPNDTVELVALSNLYIASVSSTIRWALALGIPTINYDIYNYNYGDFEGAKNYRVVTSKEDFKGSFMDFYGEICSASLGLNDLQPEFALLDGKSQHRILNLFHDLIKFKS